MRRDTIKYNNLEALLGHPIDLVRVFFEHVPYLVEEARTKGLANAYSYRGFHVAGAIYAANLSLNEGWEDSAGNTKRRPDKDKVCVEKKLLRRAAKVGMTTVIGMVVLGTSNKELIHQVTDFATPTLQFCQDSCAPEMRTNRMISPNTLFVTAGLEDDVNQAFTVGQILDGYDNVSDLARARLFKAKPDFKDWNSRLLTYDLAMNAMRGSNPSLESRQQLAQLAMAGELLAA